MNNQFRYILFFFPLLAATHAFAQDGQFLDKKAGRHYFISADKVNVRKSPSVSSEKLVQLPIGTTVYALQNSEQKYSVNGFEDTWYRVKLTYRDTLYNGYVWGGFLSADTAESLIAGDMYYMLTPSGMQKEDGWDQLYVHLRLLRGQQELARIEFKAVGSVSTWHAIHPLGNRGVNGIKEVIRVEFSDGYCGGAAGEVIFFWDGNKLHFVKELMNGFDAPAFYHEDLIFPADSGGKAGTILFTARGGEYNDEGIEILDINEKQKFVWNGKSLIKQ
jgi:hypothetical protein